MVDYRKVIEGSRYATIFNRMDGGKGLMVAAQSFVSKALEELETLDRVRKSGELLNGTKRERLAKK